MTVESECSLAAEEIQGYPDSTPLNELEHILPTRIYNLLTEEAYPCYQTIRDVKNASVLELSQIRGCGAVSIRRILKIFPRMNSKQDRAYLEINLRDWFAGQALVGIAADPDLDSILSYSNVAKLAYGQADAMLTEREKWIDGKATHPQPSEPEEG